MRNLEVFQQADTLLFDVLAISATLRHPGHFTIGDQLRRAALSVPLNLVEGSQRTTTREYGRFVEVAAGSAAETRYLLSVTARLHPHDERVRRLEEAYDLLVRRLHALRKQLGAFADAERRQPPPCASSPAP